MASESRYSVPFYQVPDELLKSPDTNVYHIAVFNVIAMHAGKDRRAWPSISRIASLTGASRAKARSTIRELEAMGWLLVTMRKSGDGLNETNLYELQPSLQGRSPHGGGVGHDMVGGTPPHGAEPYSLNQTQLNQSGNRHQSDKIKHGTLKVPMNATRYNNLVSQYGTRMVDDYIERVKDWAANKTRKRIRDYASAAANWMKRDDVPKLTVKIFNPEEHK